ncbi:hypothetical protein ACFL47_04585 [Candidatus Latescibacterota bacterium]
MAAIVIHLGFSFEMAAVDGMIDNREIEEAVTVEIRSESIGS